MKIRFIRQDGMRAKGDVFDMLPHMAQLFIKRGVAVEVNETDDDDQKAVHHAPHDKALRRTISYKG